MQKPKILLMALSCAMGPSLLWAQTRSAPPSPPEPTPVVQESVEVGQEKPVTVVADDTLLPLDVLEQKAQQGDAKAQFLLAARYDQAVGVARDYAKAVYWYEQAANQGNLDAQNNLGVLYFYGYAVPWDDDKAFEWFEKAAKAGHPMAQFNLGLMYDLGRGVRRDDAQARHWYEQAAQAGVAAAQNNLGVFYGKGRGGLVRSREEEGKWYRLAAAQGHEIAKNNLQRWEMIESICTQAKTRTREAIWPQFSQCIDKPPIVAARKIAGHYRMVALEALTRENGLEEEAERYAKAYEAPPLYYPMTVAKAAGIYQAWSEALREEKVSQEVEDDYYRLLGDAMQCSFDFKELPVMCK